MGRSVKNTRLRYRKRTAKSSQFRGGAVQHTNDVEMTPLPPAPIDPVFSDAQSTSTPAAVEPEHPTVTADATPDLPASTVATAVEPEPIPSTTPIVTAPPVVVEPEPAAGPGAVTAIEDPTQSTVPVIAPAATAHSNTTVDIASNSTTDSPATAATAASAVEPDPIPTSVPADAPAASTPGPAAAPATTAPAELGAPAIVVEAAQPSSSDEPEVEIELAPIPHASAAPNTVAPEVSSTPIPQSPDVSATPATSNESTLDSGKINYQFDKTMLEKLSMNLNKNIIINLEAYINVLDKIQRTNTTPDPLLESKKNKLSAMLVELNGFLSPETLDELKNSRASENFINNILASESAALLASMAAAAVMLGGGKKHTRRTKRTNKFMSRKTRRN